MSVNGIGGGGRNVGGIGAADAALAPEATGESGGVGESGAAAHTAAPGALERLGRGEISVDQYLDVRVADAVQHLEGRVPAAQMDFIRSALRDSLAADPVVAELVRRATGAVPPSRAD
jgi:hypothetical protein